MGKRISATEAARNFSELLAMVRFQGSRYTIVRGGKSMATLGPAEPPIHERSFAELKEIWKQIPRLGKEAESFERDLRAAARKSARPPRKSAWE